MKIARPEAGSVLSEAVQCVCVCAGVNLSPQYSGAGVKIKLGS